MNQPHLVSELDTSYTINSDNNHNIITPISPEPNHLELHDTTSVGGCNLQSPTAFCHHDYSTMPTFEDILSGTSQAPYSRVAFASFLKKIHSLENLEFLIHSNYYLLNISNTENQYHQDHEIQSRSIWDLLYKNFISLDSPKEVNIPYEIKNELLTIHQLDQLPSFELISNTMIIIKDLLRDAYLQFVSSVKRSSINENYKFQQQNHNHNSQFQQANHLPTPQYEISDPGVETFSPLDNTRSVSPLSYTQESITTSPNKAGEQVLPIPRSTGNIVTGLKSDESLITEEFVVDEDCCYSSSNSATTNSAAGGDSKKSSVSSEKSSNKNSISEVSKKIAGKLKWRRLSSNSS